MAGKTGKFSVRTSDGKAAEHVFEGSGIRIGRLDTCEIFLDHPAVSRVHAGINFAKSKYSIVNLSSSNPMTVNGRRLASKESDILAEGDVIQIGPFAIVARFELKSILLEVRQAAGTPIEPQSAASPEPAETGGVLDVFWEKRTRDESDEWATRLRPTERPKPGKAMFNWRPTADLKRQWRIGIFVWAVIIVGAIAVFAYFKFPAAYAPKPLSRPHALAFETSRIAAASNGNSCTTCHTPNDPIENSCVRCHEAAEFHASNTKAHEEAGVTCTVCHTEHQGEDYRITHMAIQSCAQCHSDSNQQTYNGRSVRTAHGGSYGYPAVNGVWNWKGVYREVADAIPEINSAATGDKSEQARLSRHFHTVHVGRLKAPEGVGGDSRGFVSCSSCHKSFDPIDRTTPRETCAACHANKAGDAGRDARFKAGQANCISCHVQHPYSTGRWKEFMTDDAVQRRVEAITAKIETLKK